MVTADEVDEHSQHDGEGNDRQKLTACDGSKWIRRNQPVDLLIKNLDQSQTGRLNRLPPPGRMAPVPG